MYAELRPIPLSKDNEVELRFTTVYEDARDPDGEQIKFQLILDQATLANLKEVLSGTS